MTQDGRENWPQEQKLKVEKAGSGLQRKRCPNKAAASLQPRPALGLLGPRRPRRAQRGGAGGWTSRMTNSTSAQVAEPRSFPTVWRHSGLLGCDCQEAAAMPPGPLPQSPGCPAVSSLWLGPAFPTHWGPADAAQVQEGPPSSRAVSTEALGV